jgi:HNH endonuclease
MRGKRNTVADIPDIIKANIRIDPDTGCWLWTRACHGFGYGHLRVTMAEIPAHRASYSVFVGEIPNGMFVCHKCDIPACVNPEHLFLATNIENTADRTKKKRQAKGEAFNRKLKESDVEKILHLTNLRIPLRVIAAQFGVSHTMIRHIKDHLKWKHIDIQ